MAATSADLTMARPVCKLQGAHVYGCCVVSACVVCITTQEYAFLPPAYGVLLYPSKFQSKNMISA